MERLWIVDGIAVTVSLVDFVDPALVGEVDVRERGVRLEVRRVDEVASGSIYSSREVVVRPALVRVDLLESGPGAADRMHWHPEMIDGEPGDRVLDPAIAEGPTEWTRDLLSHLHERLGPSAGDAVAALAEEITGQVDLLLATSREPWPAARHDERGLAVS